MVSGVWGNQNGNLTWPSWHNEIDNLDGLVLQGWSTETEIKYIVFGLGGEGGEGCVGAKIYVKCSLMLLHLDSNIAACDCLQ